MMASIYQEMEWSGQSFEDACFNVFKHLQERQEEREEVEESRQAQQASGSTTRRRFMILNPFLAGINPLFGSVQTNPFATAPGMREFGVPSVATMRRRPQTRHGSAPQPSRSPMLPPPTREEQARNAISMLRSAAQQQPSMPITGRGGHAGAADVPEPAAPPQLNNLPRPTRSSVFPPSVYARALEQRARGPPSMRGPVGPGLSAPPGRRPFAGDPFLAPPEIRDDVFNPENALYEYDRRQAQIAARQAEEASGRLSTNPFDTHIDPPPGLNADGTNVRTDGESDDERSEGEISVPYSPLDEQVDGADHLSEGEITNADSMLTAEGSSLSAAERIERSLDELDAILMGTGTSFPSMASQETETSDVSEQSQSTTTSSITEQVGRRSAVDEVSPTAHELIERTRLTHGPTAHELIERTRQILRRRHPSWQGDGGPERAIATANLMSLSDAADTLRLARERDRDFQLQRTAEMGATLMPSSAESDGEVQVHPDNAPAPRGSGPLPVPAAPQPAPITIQGQGTHLYTPPIAAEPTRLPIRPYDQTGPGSAYEQEMNRIHANQQAEMSRIHSQQQEVVEQMHERQRQITEQHEERQRQISEQHEQRQRQITEQQDARVQHLTEQSQQRQRQLSEQAAARQAALQQQIRQRQTQITDAITARTQQITQEVNELHRRHVEQIELARQQIHAAIDNVGSGLGGGLVPEPVTTGIGGGLMPEPVQTGQMDHGGPGGPPPPPPLGVTSTIHTNPQPPVHPPPFPPQPASPPPRPANSLLTNTGSWPPAGPQQSGPRRNNRRNRQPSWQRRFPMPFSQRFAGLLPRRNIPRPPPYPPPPQTERPPPPPGPPVAQGGRDLFNSQHGQAPRAGGPGLSPLFLPANLMTPSEQNAFLQNAVRHRVEASHQFGQAAMRAVAARQQEQRATHSALTEALNSRRMALAASQAARQMRSSSAGVRSRHGSEASTQSAPVTQAEHAIADQLVNGRSDEMSGDNLQISSQVLFILKNV